MRAEDRGSSVAARSSETLEYESRRRRPSECRLSGLDQLDLNAVDGRKAADGESRSLQVSIGPPNAKKRGSIAVLPSFDSLSVPGSTEWAMRSPPTT